MQCRPAQEHLPRTQAVVELAGQIAGCGGVYSVAHGEYDAALAGNRAAGKGGVVVLAIEPGFISNVGPGRRVTAALAAVRTADAPGIDWGIRSSGPGKVILHRRSPHRVAAATVRRPGEVAAHSRAGARREFLQGLMEAVAEQRLSVVLSSHLVADLERVCDYLVVLVASRVRVAGEVSALLAAHHRL